MKIMSEMLVCLRIETNKYHLCHRESYCAEIPDMSI